MSHAMKLNQNKSIILPPVKYFALLVAFALGYQVAGKDYPHATALVGWVLGFVVGLKLRLLFANKS